MRRDSSKATDVRLKVGDALLKIITRCGQVRVLEFPVIVVMKFNCILFSWCQSTQSRSCPPYSRFEENDDFTFSHIPMVSLRWPVIQTLYCEHPAWRSYRSCASCCAIRCTRTLLTLSRASLAYIAIGSQRFVRIAPVLYASDERPRFGEGPCTLFRRCSRD